MVGLPRGVYKKRRPAGSEPPETVCGRRRAPSSSPSAPSSLVVIDHASPDCPGVLLPHVRGEEKGKYHPLGRRAPPRNTLEGYQGARDPAAQRAVQPPSMTSVWPVTYAASALARYAAAAATPASVPP